MAWNDVIVAAITPPGEGAVGAIRLSGPECWAVARRFLRTRDGKHATAQNRRMTLAHAIRPGNGQIVDEVLFVLMKGPGSYTGEDVVEVFGHGGPIVIRSLLRAALDAGARLAEAGEFTRRAFVNGRMDLSQAEAVIDLIRAKTDRGARLALRQLNGELSRTIEQIENPLLLEAAAIEAELDFPDDEVAEADLDRLAIRLAEWRMALELLAERAEGGRLVREGATVAIVGPPNVGKSSLLNALVHAERAIVTEVAGTTRDAIEEWVNFEGLPVRLVDTAGIRETADKVERIGVERARRYLMEADAVLFMVDAGEPIDPMHLEIFRLLAGKPAVVVLNKVDRPERISVAQAEVLFPGLKVLRLSLHDQSGLRDLEQAILDMVFRGAAPADDTVAITNERHRKAVLDAIAAICSAQKAISVHAELELVVSDLRVALEALGRITGRSADESVVDAIFSHFCVGK